MLIINTCLEQPGEPETWAQYISKSEQDTQAALSYLAGVIAFLRGDLHVYIHYQEEGDGT